MEDIDKLRTSTAKDVVLKQPSSKQSITIVDIDRDSKTSKNISKNDSRFTKRLSKVGGSMAPRGSIMQRTDRKQSVSRRASMRRQSQRENTMATGRPKVGLIDFERLKAEVYRDWVGRRDAFDLGTFKAKSKSQPKSKQKPPKKSKDEKEEDKGESPELESSQVKGVLRDTKGLEATLQQVEDVKRRADATTPLVRKSSATGAKPLRTPSSTALRVGSRNAFETPPEEIVQFQEVGADDMRKLAAISRRAKRKGGGKVDAKKKVAEHKSKSSHGLTSQQVRGK